MAEDPLKSCFVISPIGNDGTEIRRQADDVFDFIIKPVLLSLGYQCPIRADKTGKPGMIGEEIVNYILDADLVIADLSHHNPNVFYELAIRHALRKPIIHMIYHEESIPFDVIQFRCIKYNHRDLRYTEHTKIELWESVQHFIRDASFTVNSPISQSIDLRLLSSNAISQEDKEAKIISLLHSLHSEINNIKSDLQQQNQANENRYALGNVFNWQEIGVQNASSVPKLQPYRFYLQQPNEACPIQTLEGITNQWLGNNGEILELKVGENGIGQIAPHTKLKNS